MKRTKVYLKHSVEIAVLHQVSGVRITKIQEMYPQYSMTSVHCHAKKEIGEKPGDWRNSFQDTSKIPRPQSHRECVSFADK